MLDVTCEHCSAPFLAIKSSKRFCSERCRKRAESKRRDNRNRKPRVVISRGTCRVCGTSDGMDWCAHHQSSMTATYCRDCWNARCRDYYRANSNFYDRREQAARRSVQRWASGIRACGYCASEFTQTHPNHKFCSERCRAHSRRPTPKAKVATKPGPSRRIAFRDCSVCGKLMAVHNHRKFCSDQCRLEESSNRLMGLYRAALQVVDVKLAMHWHRQLCAYLAHRDGDCCGICGDPVDISLPSGTRGLDCGPSVDHIIPHSTGGSDDLTNLRLTHWACNRNRGNRGGFEQLRLLG